MERVMALLQEFTDKIQEFMKANAPLRADKQNMDPLLRLESYVSRTELNNSLTLVSQYKKEISPESLTPFVDLLARRWRDIQNCDASYFYNENSYINLVYIKIAQILGKYLNVEPYSLLMPGLKGLDPKRKLHEYICRGNPIEVMLVEDGFALLEKKYPPVDPDSDDDIPEFETGLEIDKEEQLLANHSELASKYYAALRWKIGDREQLKEEFLTSLRSNDYKANNEKISLYNNKHLIAGILARTAHSKHDFIQLLKKLPVEHWKAFLSYVPKEDLFKFMLGTNDVKKLRERFRDVMTEKNIKLESYHPLYERALGVAYAMTYKHMRDLEGTWTSRVAQTVGRWLPKTGFFAKACSYVVEPPVMNTVKLDGVDFYIDYLLDVRNPIGGFDVYLERKECEAVRPAFKGGVLESLVGKLGFMNRLYADRRSAQAEGKVQERRENKSGIRMSI